MKTDSVKGFLLDQLRALPGLECGAMFGGFGLYAGARFFGLLYQGRLHFKTTAASRTPYVQRGRQPFQPNAPQQLSAYLEVLAGGIENANELAASAREAVNAAKE